jgi:predicted RNase H-like HicB family nuclease
MDNNIPDRKGGDGSGLTEKGERLMVLRCNIVKRENKLFIGKCLELGVCAQGKTGRECKRNLTEAIEAYIEAARQARGDIVIRRVPYYSIQRIIFDIKYGMKQSSERKNGYFKTERSVPVGV